MERRRQCISNIALIGTMLTCLLVGARETTALEVGEEAPAILAKVRKDEVDGILQPPPIASNIPGFILETARQQGIPTMFDTAFYVEQSGGLASYGPDLFATGRQTARLVDKILKGTKPAEIPVETNSQIEFVIN